MQIVQTLQQDRLIAIEIPVGGKVRVSEGCIWFTDDGEDIVLTAGQRYEARRPERWLLQALSDSRVEITTPAVAAPARHWWSDWRDRLLSLN